MNPPRSSANSNPLAGEQTAPRTAGSSAPGAGIAGLPGHGLPRPSMTSPGPTVGSGVPSGGMSPPVPVLAAAGPATVINPEGRPKPAALSAPSSESLVLQPVSSVARILFPPMQEGMDDAAADLPDNGVQLGQFKIVERIRTGGMGAVFRAIDLSLDRTVALKVLPPGASRDPHSIQRFQHEAKSAAWLSHANIARVFASGEDRGLHYIAFEFIEGLNLRELIARHTQMPVADAVQITLQMALALNHMASRKVVHRDIKPSNIIVGPGGHATLVDLGLARSDLRSESQADLTLSGTTLGTFDYISPEQARDPRSADVRSDIYSLGCTLYHMLTGEPPYPQGTVLQKLLQHQGDDAPDPRQKNRKVPQSLAVIVRTMMAKDVRKRYQSPDLLIRDLLVVAGHYGWQPGVAADLLGVAPKGHRLRSILERQAVWIVSAVALIVIVLGLEYGSSRPMSDSEGSSRTALSQPKSATGLRPTAAGPRPTTTAATDSSKTSQSGRIPATESAESSERSGTELANASDSAAERAAQDNASADPEAMLAGNTDSETEPSGRSSKPNESTGPRVVGSRPAGRSAGPGSEPGDPGTGSRSAVSSITEADLLQGSTSLLSQVGKVALGTDPDNRSRPTGDSTTSAPLAESTSPGRTDLPLADLQLFPNSLAETGLFPPGDSTSPAGADDARLMARDLRELFRLGPDSTGRSSTLASAVAPGTTPRPADSAASATRGSTDPVRVDRPFALIGKEGSEQRYASLEAACAAAADGGIIEIQGAGPYREPPLRISKKLILRAARGSRPVIELVPAVVPGEGMQTRMITLVGGSLDMAGLELRMVVQPEIVASSWALFSGQRLEHLRLQGCVLTIVNVDRKPAAFCELDPGPSLRMPEMDMNRPTMRSVFGLEWENCLVRGESDLLQTHTSEATRVSFRNCAILVRGSLLKSIALPESAVETTPLELRIEQSTVATGDGLLNLETSRTSRRLFSVQATTSNSIFANLSTEPLVKTSGMASRTDQRSALVWAGQKNFYSRYRDFWVLGAGDPGSPPETLSFDQWKQQWTAAGEVDPLSETIPFARSWSERPLWELNPRDVELAGDATTNRAIGGSTSGSNAGVNLRTLTELGIGLSVSSQATSRDATLK